MKSWNERKLRKKYIINLLNRLMILRIFLISLLKYLRIILKRKEGEGDKRGRNY